MNDEKLQEFLEKFDNLLKEYEVTMMADNIGDVMLDHKSGKILGYWPGKVDKGNFEQW